MKDRFVFGVVILLLVNGDVGFAGWFEDEGTVELGVVEADQVVGAVGLVHGPVG